MNNNLLNESQFDFLINNSAEHAVLKLTRNIAQNIDNGKFKLGVVIDLSNAFDTIDNNFLPEKLKHRVNERHWLGSEVIFSKENNILKIIMTSNIYLKLIVVSCSGLYLDLLFFLYMTINLHFTSRKNIDKQNYMIARYQYIGKYLGV